MATNTINLLISDAVGIYLPREFARGFSMNAWHVEPEDEEILLDGPDHPSYDDAWDNVLRSAWFRIPKGYKEGSRPGKWRLWQDGNLFAVHEDHKFED